MAAYSYLGTTSIIIAECMALRDDMLAAKNDGFLSLEIEGDSKIVVGCSNKMISASCSIRILMEDIWKLSKELNIYTCPYIYREANRTTYCISKKGIGIIDLRILLSNFPKDITNISFEDYNGSLFNCLYKLSVV